MALWQQIQQSPSIQPKVRELYDKEGISIEIRHFLAPWIEAQVWELDPTTFLKGLNEGLQRQVETQPFITTDRLCKIQASLNTQFGSNPQELQTKIQECLKAEYWLIQDEEKRVIEKLTQELANKQLDDPNNEVDIGGAAVVEKDSNLWIIQLKRRSDETAGMIRQLENLQKEFTASLDEDQKIQGIILYQNNLGTEAIVDVVNKLKQRQEDIRLKIRHTGKWIRNINSHLESKLGEILSELTTLQTKNLYKDIENWKYEQQRSIIGYPSAIPFTKVKELSENIADVLWTIRQQLKLAGEISISLPILTEDRNLNEFFQTRFNQATNLLKELYHKTFLIEHQSLPIIRTDTRFYPNQWKKQLTVGSLIAQKLNPRLCPPEVRVTIVSKGTAEIIREQGLSGLDLDDLQTTGDLTDNICRMEACNPESPYFAAVFRHIRLRNLSRHLESRRRGTSTGELVTDEKFYLLCTTDFSIIGDIETFQVWTMSSPIVLTTHWSQDCRAWGTLLWDYGLSEIDRRSLDVSDSAPWPKIMELLNAFFCNSIGVQLTAEQCQCLTKKAIRMGNQIQTFEDLCKKELMEGKKFSFWDWFYYSMRLAEKHFKNEWRAGYINGFCSKDKAEELLIQQNCQTGTFLMRFSDSIPGAISVAGRMDDGRVYSLNPFGTKELERRSLADRINDLVQFLTIYPNTPKAQVFGDVASNTQPPISNKPDYLRAFQITVIDPGFRLMTGSFSPAGAQVDEKLDDIINDLLRANWGEHSLPTFDDGELNMVLDTIMEQE